METFMFYSGDGYTADNKGKRRCNFQILDFIVAENYEKALIQFKDKKRDYGFKHIYVAKTENNNYCEFYND